MTYRVARIQWGERRQDVAERREMEEARTRREAWKNDYDSVHAMLIDAANVAYQVSHRGPLTRRDFADLDTLLLHTNLEQASQRTPDELEAPLLEVAKHVANLLPQAVASDAETLDTYELVRQGEAAAVPAERTIRSEHIRTVAQAPGRRGPRGGRQGSAPRTDQSLGRMITRSWRSVPSQTIWPRLGAVTCGDRMS
ncbi:hypothetical protein ACFY1B_51330 [Streptomyces mirabilis]|uniref:hypothetical protein n=1 Tax=Streptomyces mirabilis TaxID=68239 RepID=UPI0036BF9779